MRTQRHETHRDGLIPGHTVQGRGRGAWTLCLITALLLTPACTLIGPVPSSNDRAILFAPATTFSETSGDGGQITSFNVWGYNHVSDDHGRSNVIFNCVPVALENGSWNYSDIRYWIPGMNYDFYAVTPTAAAAELRTSNDAPWHLTIPSFDITTLTSDDTAADLRLAVSDCLAFDPEAQPNGPEPVALAFNCLLARISITLESEASADASSSEEWSAEIVGLPRYGTFSSRLYDSRDAATASSCWTLSEETYTETRVTGLSVFPQVLDGSIALNISGLPTADRDGDGREGNTAIVRLSTPTGQWEAGIHYHYTFTIEEDGTLRHGDPETEPIN